MRLNISRYFMQNYASSLKTILLLLISNSIIRTSIASELVKCNGICMENNFIPEPNLLVSGKTCAQWDKHASKTILESHCDSFKSSLGAACGCNNLPKPSCSVCPYGYNWGSTIEYRNGSQETCEYALFLMSISTEACDMYSEHFSRYCCSNSCKICHGNSFSPQSNIDNENGLSLSCQDISISSTLLYEYSEECKTVQAKAAKYCNCGGQKEVCTLCPDGGYPPLENGFIPQDDSSPMSCKDAYKEVSLVDVSSKECSRAQSDGTYYCGCGLSSERCSLCGDGKRVRNNLRDKEVVDHIGNKVSCAAYESYLNTLEKTSEKCSKLNLLMSECCGEIKS